jgi:hypothetical protein
VPGGEPGHCLHAANRFCAVGQESVVLQDHALHALALAAKRSRGTKHPLASRDGIEHELRPLLQAEDHRALILQARQPAANLPAGRLAGQDVINENVTLRRRVSPARQAADRSQPQHRDSGRTQPVDL